MLLYFYLIQHFVLSLTFHQLWNTYMVNEHWENTHVMFIVPKPNNASNHQPVLKQPHKTPSCGKFIFDIPPEESIKCMLPVHKWFGWFEFAKHRYVPFISLVGGGGGGRGLVYCHPGRGCNDFLNAIRFVSGLIQFDMVTFVVRERWFLFNIGAGF